MTSNLMSHISERDYATEVNILIYKLIYSLEPEEGFSDLQKDRINEHLMDLDPILKDVRFLTKRAVE